MTDEWKTQLTKSALHQLIEEVKNGNSHAISQATDFVACESFGLWHNRARAKLCRHFKNHPPAQADCSKMVDAIAQRLIDGRFSEQFIDQLLMAIRFDHNRMRTVAFTALAVEKDYVRRYAERVIHILNSSSNVPLR